MAKKQKPARRTPERKQPERKRPRARIPRVKALVAIAAAGAASFALRAAFRFVRERRDRDRLRHAEGQPTERPPDAPVAGA
ncbi:MAG TPA: hypothetical protein VIL20_01395 [Sandaracinaceae bacterium]